MLLVVCLALVGLVSCGGGGSAMAPGVQEFGNTFEGSNSVNWGGGRYAGSQFDLAFIAGYSKMLDTIWICWRTGTGYGGGTLGIWNFELHTDNPDGHIPSATIISQLKGVTNPPDGYFQIKLPQVMLRAGQVYHLIIYNTDPDPLDNWSSPNMIRSPAEIPWQGEGLLVSNGTGWMPMKSTDPNQVAIYNGNARAAYLLHYTDGAAEGLPYYSAAQDNIYGGLYQGEQFTWQHPDSQVSELGFSVFKIGAPAAPLTFYLVELGGSILVSGNLAQAAAVTKVPQWYRVNITPTVTLRQGATYRLFLRSDGSVDANNCYAVYMPYSSSDVPGWPELTWGGREDGGYAYCLNDAWNFDTSVPHDLSFSLQATVGK